MIKDEAKWEFDAVKNLIPTGILVIQKQDLSFEYRNVPNGFVAPTREGLDAEVNRLKAEYDAQAYARSRQAEYPPLAEQLDHIFHNGVASWKTNVIQPVKDKYPKP